MQSGTTQNKIRINDSLTSQLFGRNSFYVLTSDTNIAATAKALINSPIRDRIYLCGLTDEDYDRHYDNLIEDLKVTHVGMHNVSRHVVENFFDHLNRALNDRDRGRLLHLQALALDGLDDETLTVIQKYLILCRMKDITIKLIFAETIAPIWQTNLSMLTDDFTLKKRSTQLLSYLLLDHLQYAKKLDSLNRDIQQLETNLTTITKVDTNKIEHLTDDLTVAKTELEEWKDKFKKTNDDALTAANKFKKANEQSQGVINQLKTKSTVLATENDQLKQELNNLKTLLQKSQENEMQITAQRDALAMRLQSAEKTQSIEDLQENNQSRKKRKSPTPDEKSALTPEAMENLTVANYLLMLKQAAQNGDDSIDEEDLNINDDLQNIPLKIRVQMSLLKSLGKLPSFNLPDTELEALINKQLARIDGIFQEGKGWFEITDTRISAIIVYLCYILCRPPKSQEITAELPQTNFSLDVFMNMVDALKEASGANNAFKLAQMDTAAKIKKLETELQMQLTNTTMTINNLNAQMFKQGHVLNNAYTLITYIKNIANIESQDFYNTIVEVSNDILNTGTVLNCMPPPAVPTVNPSSAILNRDISSSHPVPTANTSPTASNRSAFFNVVTQHNDISPLLPSVEQPVVRH